MSTVKKRTVNGLFTPVVTVKTTLASRKSIHLEVALKPRSKATILQEFEAKARKRFA
ncbi:hypothetical protein [Deefgea piscis]|uniref:hypothetical protein n=1 Tax=Deefgea piscis TaxID=2739061 RepID=UPI001C803F0B|nr:hypothetical protein [Deefgea piscis]QZA80846.1 hypothetical protein K4H25_15350 [Deefgea piscis]